LKRKVFNPSVAFSTNAHIKNIDQYNEEYQKSITNNNQFWAKKADRLSWIKKWDSIGEYDFVKANIKWFEVMRHVKSHFINRSLLSPINWSVHIAHCAM